MIPKKRHRRRANEVERQFFCYCGLAYVSEGALNQHKKNKGHTDEERQANYNAMERESPTFGHNTIDEK